MRPTNAKALESIVRAKGAPLFDDFQRFHLSVNQKLWSVNYYRDQTDNLKPITEAELVSKVKTTTGTEEYLVKTIPKKDEFALYANLVVDGFLMNAMAALDTLAHEIKVLYTFPAAAGKKPSSKDKVYITTIQRDLRKVHPLSKLTAYLSSELKREWFRTLAAYRHCTTHERIVGGKARIDWELVSGSWNNPDVVILLPDDPTSTPLSYKLNRELKSYCNSTWTSLSKMVSRSYGSIIQDTKSAGNVLPMP